MENAGTLATAEAAPSATAPAAAPAAAAPAAPTAAPAQAPAAQTPVEKTATELKAEADAKAAALAAETPEAKAARETQEAADKAKAEAGKVPEKYEFKPPEGIKLDADITGKFEAAAREAGLTQEKAQALYELGAQAVLKAQNTMTESVKSAQASWLEASKADKEFGGDKLNENLAVAKKALEISPEIKTLLNESRLGDHPEMIRWMVRVGKKLSEDSFVPGARAPADAGDLASKLYPNHKP
jgi:hypothetical protein